MKEALDDLLKEGGHANFLVTVRGTSKTLVSLLIVRSLVLLYLLTMIQNYLMSQFRDKTGFYVVTQQDMLIQFMEKV